MLRLLLLSVVLGVTLSSAISLWADTISNTGTGIEINPWHLVDECAEKTNDLRLINDDRSPTDSEDTSESDPLDIEFSIGTVCPELISLVESSPLAVGVQGSFADLYLSDVENILTLEEFYAQPRGGQAMDRQSLHSIIEALPLAPVELSLVDQAWRWLRDFFSSQEGSAPEWLDFSISKEQAQFVQYLVGGALVLAALFIVINEIRLSHRRRSQQYENYRGTTHRPSAQNLTDIHNAPLAEQPSKILERLLAALEARKLIRVDLTRTHRDVMRLQLPPVTDTLHEVACTAEGQVYGSKAASAEEIRVLHEALAEAEQAIPLMKQHDRA